MAVDYQANKYQKFIFEFIKTAHLDAMSPDVAHTFQEYSKSGEFIGNMKNWNNEKGRKVEFDASVADEEYKKAYKAFLAVFEVMKGKESDLPKDIKEKFLDVYWGNGKVFNSPKPINSAIETKLDDFATRFLEDQNEQKITDLFNNENFSLRYNFANNRFDFKEFKKGIQDKKYNENPEFRKQVLEVVKFVKSYSGVEGIWPQNLGTYDFNTPGVPDNVDEWFVARYNPGFKAAFPKLLTALASDKKFREKFAEYDSDGTISKNVTKGLEKTAYDDSKSDDFVEPSYKDTYGPIGFVKKKLHKFAENSIHPWSNILRGTRRFFTPARSVIEAFDSVKIKAEGPDGKSTNRPLKPTDGLKGILDNKDAIKAKISSPLAKKQFEWFVEKMDIYSKRMPEAFDGALRNPFKMRKIVSRIIIDAVKDGKKAEAKTAMEILSTMKYGFIHSRTVDALDKTDLSVLGDKELSWNKYEGIQFVTKAMDKTAKYALLGIGRVIAAVGNFGMRRLTKFRGKSKHLESVHNQWKSENNPQGVQNEINILNSEIANTDARLTAQDARLTAAGFMSASALEARIDNDKRNILLLQQAVDRNERLVSYANQTYSGAEQAYNDLVEQKKKLEEEKNKKQATIKKLREQIINIKKLIRTGHSGNKKDTYEEEIAKREILIADLQKSITKIDKQIAGGATALQTARQNKTIARNNKIRADRDLQRAKADFDNNNRTIANNQNMLDDYNNAKADKDSLIAQKTEAENRQGHDAWNKDHPDEYLELMAFWDMLETFRKSHHFSLMANRMRDKFLTKDSANKSKADNVFEAYLDKYKQKYAA